MEEFNFNKKSAENYALINADILFPGKKILSRSNLLIKNMLIEDFGNHIKVNELNDDYKIIDCNGLIVSPGIIDMRVQIREPGLEHQETIKSISKSACSGGIPSLVCLPNSSPVIEQPVHSM